MSLLARSTSPYLRQHARNPVAWYPWGPEALLTARAENKPILLSIGYSTCHWCHVMEREVFMNPSIATFMNAHFVNIKIDREEHPAIDELYMIARQMLTHEGGWPNHVFLTPDLKPFYAGGTFGPDASYGRPAFPRLLEWLHHTWTTEEGEVRKSASGLTEAIRRYVDITPSSGAYPNVAPLADQLFLFLKEHHDGRGGGFFQAPKFPQEPSLAFLLAYHERTQDPQALAIVERSLKKMAAGGFYDQVGCGFHRYAVDKEWYVPHFEKMLYTQAQLARVTTDAARITGNPWLAHIARCTLEFVLGPMTEGNGGFYAAIDAETDGVEGAHYAWSAEEISRLLSPAETEFFTRFYALADIPAFPGHPHPDGQALILRAPLDEAAQAHGMPYAQAAAMCGHVMNKLLNVRNRRPAPRIDDKIIVAWNGLMIDALAHGGQVFAEPRYTQAAGRAAAYLLEAAIDDRGQLQRIVSGSRAAIPATLEDYACLAKGLLTLHSVSGDGAHLAAAKSLCDRADEQFADRAGGGYFLTAEADLPIRLKNADDSAMPAASAVMLENAARLYAVTGEEIYLRRAEGLRDYYLGGGVRAPMEMAGFIRAAMELGAPALASASPARFVEAESDAIVTISAALFPKDAKPGETCEAIVTLEIKDGWHIAGHQAASPSQIPTQLDAGGEGVRLCGVVYPEGVKNYAGLIHLTARLALDRGPPARPPIKLRLRYQPCSESACLPVVDHVLTV